MRLDGQIVKQQLSNLLISFPELADDEILRADMIEAETDLHELLTKLVEVREEAKAFQVGIKSRESDLASRKSRLARRQEAAEELIENLMRAANQKSLPLPIATISIGAARSKVVITDEKLVPEAYCKTERTPKKAEIFDALKKGDTIAGCELSNGGEQLNIRVK